MRGITAVLGFVLALVLLLCPAASAACIDYSQYMHWECGVGEPGAAYFDLCLSGHYAYVAKQDVLGGDRGLEVVDVGNPLRPQLAGGVTTAGQPECVAVSGDVAFLTCGGEGRGLVAIDIRDPQNPSITGFLAFAMDPHGLAVFGAHAYIAGGSARLLVVDISDPQRMRIVGALPSLSATSGAHDVTVAGSFAYLAEEAGLRVIDISVPERPRCVGVAESAVGNGVVVEGGRAYVVSEYGGFYVVDVVNPHSPRVVAHLPEAGGFSLTITGTHALVACWRGVEAVDIANPVSPQLTGTLKTYYPYAIAASGPYAYVADYSYFSVIELGSFQSAAIIGALPDLHRVEEVAVAGHHAYVPETDGPFNILDVTDPANPQIVGSLQTGGFAYGVAVSGSYAYVTVRIPPYTGSQLLAIDISDDRNPRIAGRMNTLHWADRVISAGGHVYFTTESHFHIAGIAQPAHPVETASIRIASGTTHFDVAGSLAFVTSNTGLSVIDVSDPHSPEVIGTVENLDQCRDVAVSGGYAYVAEGYRGLTVIDVSDPRNPYVVGNGPMLNLTDGVAVRGGYAYINDWCGRVQVFDVSIPSMPDIVGSVDLPCFEASRLVVADDLVYVANYYGGLQVVPAQCEPSTLPAFSGEGPGSMGPCAFRAFPNPTSDRTALRLAVPASGLISAGVYDVSGRQVRDLGGWRKGGAQELIWDGRGDDGRPVAAGVYVARCRVAGEERSARVVVLR